MLDEKVAVVLFAPERDVLAQRIVAQGGLPIQFQGNLLDLRRAVSGRVQSADHRTHAGTGDGMDRDIACLELLEHTDVGQPPGAAAGQYQAGTQLLRSDEGCDDKQHKQAEAFEHENDLNSSRT